MQMRKEVIAIDGPAGSGKSTTAKLVAGKLGFVFLDTGAMYRAITLKASREKISPGDEEKLTRIAQGSHLDLREEEGVNKVYLDGEDVSELIRGSGINRVVSDISAHKKLRAVLVSKQKQLGEKHNLVAEGRDTTTVVFPDAVLKVYLDCDIRERARRRMLELQAKGTKTSLEEQVRELSARDEIDSRRDASPLKVDPEAVIVDTTNLTIEEQVNKVIELYHKKKDELLLSGRQDSN